jgi:1,2-diacylglycerol 3-beta-galactosyltransferase
MDQHPQADRPNIVFLFSDTGGGHRSACNAIIEAINLEFPDQYSTEMVDIFREVAPPPFDHAPEIYPRLSRMPDVWGLTYKASDGQRRTRALNTMVWPYVRRSINRMVTGRRCDLLVSVHQLSNAPFARALERLEKAGNRKPPFVIVVTDMVTTHAFWYDRRADLVIVPTETARERGLELGLSRERVKVVGMPVAERFSLPTGDRQALREKLGWPQDKLVVLMVGGGEGMGPLQSMDKAINQTRLPIFLAVIAGRNQKLKAKLDNCEWQIPIHSYGFVQNMPELMCAADVLITKAGPGTISEAFIAELPIILYNRLPGQEDGNVTYVVSEKAGVWAPEPEQVVDTLRRWVENPEERKLVAEASRRLAHPRASREIARLLVSQIDKKKNPLLKI